MIGWQNVLVVGVGGFVGSAGRYVLSVVLTPLGTSLRFPVGTLAVNVIGCFVIGVLAALVENTGAFTAPMRMLLFTGVLGGFTTFSAFGYETLTLARAQGLPIAGANVIAQITLGLLAVWLGHASTRVLIS